MTHIALDLELDESVDAAYITLANHPIADGSVVADIVVDDPRLRGEIVIDLDANGNVVGIEFIGYAAMLGLT